MDAQGAGRALPYVTTANATFTSLVDTDNLLGELYGFKAIPNGFLIDEDGVVRYKKLGGFDIRRAETAYALKRWLAGADPGLPQEKPLGAEHSESNALFREGMELYRRGDVEASVSLWRGAIALDPANYIVRKQIWAVEHPEMFYEGDVDYAWQKEQIEQGR